VHAADPRTQAEALLARPLGLTGSEGVPGLETYAGSGPLAHLVSVCELSAPEALAVSAALAPELDEKFSLYYRLLADRPAVEHLTGEVLRTLCARTFSGRLAVAGLLHADARLRAMKILEVDRAGDCALTGRIRPHPDLRAAITGRDRDDPSLSAEFPATRLRTVHTLDDVVVPSDVRRRLLSVVDRMRYAKTVLDDWGFARHHDDVRGTVVLFHGPPGTGKSMTAAVLARSVGLAAYRVDLSALVSKYIGETEKNLSRIFDRAEAERCVLVFDEADAIFGRRTEVSEARDRYANQEISYLLQRVEQHPGLVVLATNLLGNIDDAFSRRIDLMVEFPAPAAPERLRLWRGVLPPALPVAGDVDLPSLAQRYTMTGAEIRDATLDAAYLAAANGGVVTAEHLQTGIRGVFGRGSRSLPAVDG